MRASDLLSRCRLRRESVCVVELFSHLARTLFSDTVVDPIENCLKCSQINDEILLSDRRRSNIK